MWDYVLPNKRIILDIIYIYHPIVYMSIGQNDRYDQSSIQRGRGVATAAKPIGAWGGPFAMYQIVSVTHIMGVSENRGTPKSSILIGFSIINHPFWGTTTLGNTHVRIILGVYCKKVYWGFCSTYISGIAF